MMKSRAVTVLTPIAPTPEDRLKVFVENIADIRSSPAGEMIAGKHPMLTLDVVIEEAAAILKEIYG